MDADIFPPLPHPFDLLKEVRRLVAGAPEYEAGQGQQYVDIDENAPGAPVVGPVCLLGHALVGLGWAPADWRSYYGDLDAWLAGDDDDPPEINHEAIDTLYQAQGWPITHGEVRWLAAVQELQDSPFDYTWRQIVATADNRARVLGWFG